MKNLSDLTNKELFDFFNSFDHVLCDVDGVLWNLFGTIPGTQDAIKSLKKLGKKVILVSNNTTKSTKVYHKQLKSAGFDIDEDEIVTPILSIVAFLKKQRVDKDIFVLGMTPLKQSLQNAGFTLAANAPDRIKETLSEFASQTIVDDGSVGAVVADVDINLNYVNLQKAATFLERTEVLFLKGAPDSRLPTGSNRILIGPGCFIAILEEISGRKGVAMAKPSHHLNDYIVEKFGIADPSRVLFIGDSIPQDMGFAATCGYQKLLVLSGLTKRMEITNGIFSSEYKVDYYADSLRIIHECTLRTFASKL